MISSIGDIGAFQQLQYTNQRAQIASGLIGGISGLAGLGMALPNPTFIPQSYKKKSFKDELQSDIDAWLRDVEI